MEMSKFTSRDSMEENGVANRRVMSVVNNNDYSDGAGELAS